MSIRVLFFASLADLVGTREVYVKASDFRDVESVYADFETRFPRLTEYRNSVLFALNSEFAEPNAVIKDGDEVAFFPPVSGG
jgi:molybdopterin converting factor subunit 1